MRSTDRCASGSGLFLAVVHTRAPSQPRPTLQPLLFLSSLHCCPSRSPYHSLDRPPLFLFCYHPLSTLLLSPPFFFLPFPLYILPRIPSGEYLLVDLPHGKAAAQVEAPRLRTYGIRGSGANRPYPPVPRLSLRLLDGNKPQPRSGMEKTIRTGMLGFKKR